MKKWIFVILFLSLFELTFAQTPYKYVIIPTQFPDIAKGFNPYGVSSTLQQIMSEKGIQTVFEADERPDDYCDALIVDLEKTSTLFKNKLKVTLKDCQNNILFSKEGEGQSKEFRTGYAEALADALDGFGRLPDNTTVRYQTQAPAASVAEVIESGENDDIYKPKNLYFNDTYFVDLTEGENGLKELIIINGKLLGYEKQQKIATLTSTGLGDVYQVKWLTPQGETLSGVASLTGDKLNISLTSDNKPVVINLMKQ